MLHSFFSIWLSFWPSPLFPLGAFLIGWCQMIRPQETFGSHMKKWKVWQPRLPRLVYPDWLALVASHIYGCGWALFQVVFSIARLHLLHWIRPVWIWLRARSLSVLKQSLFRSPSGRLLCCSWIGLMLFFSPCTVYVCFTFCIAFTLHGHRWNTHEELPPTTKVRLGCLWNIATH